MAIGRVLHQRLRPAPHRLNVPTWFLLLPLRSLRAAPDATLRRNRAGWVSFHDADHGDGRADCLQWLDEQLQRAGIADADGEAWLHTYPRVLGFCFNPVSFWYCHRRDGTLAAVLAEVNNTFGGRHCYLLSGPTLAFGAEQRADKAFHVSPFCQVEGAYRFRFLRTAAAHDGGGHTLVRIDYDDASGPLLATSVSGELAELSPARLRRALRQWPLLTLGVMARIHWHALRLLLKRVPFFGTAPARQASH
ncbi:DUF1365 domain-containing protein [Aquabacterium sp. OR-4]|uniref:DUF1365 domain-containing protein n=1 Tax=Aquabacterium sp. OR-4 TaxID=2978127 RepID=UPI0021B18AEE|nr:DUF1365 domain-containing protein [Aquabacterium sp. OR-4]MDT7834046.1 DUF1365 domain-containing protein [Aquabacterium sp. OR-4]